MVNHAPMSHCDKDCLNMKINHGQLWSNTALWQILSRYENQSWLTMIQHCIVTEIVSRWKSTMVNHVPMTHCDKDSLDMKINHDQAWSSMVQGRVVTRIVSIWKSTMVNHVYFSVYNIFLMVYIPCVCNISLLGLIVFNHGQPFFIKSIMVNHGPMSHCEKYCLNMKINYDQWWSNVTLWEIFSQYENQPQSTMVQCCIVTKILSIWKSIMVKYGQIWSNVALWEGLSQYEIQPWSTMFILLFVVIILGFIYLGFIILVPWV